MTTANGKFTVVMFEDGIPLVMWSTREDGDGKTGIAQYRMEGCSDKAIALTLQMIVNPLLHPSLRVKGLVIEALLRHEVEQDMKRDIPW